MALYFIETKISEQRAMLCRRADELFTKGEKFQIVVDSSTAAQFIDQMLWTFSQASFIPHVIAGPETEKVPDEPVLIVIGERRVEGYDTLLCDSPVSAEFMCRFGNAYHFIMMDDEDRRRESRKTWQEVRELGHSPVHVPLQHPCPA